MDCDFSSNDKVPFGVKLAHRVLNFIVYKMLSLMSEVNIKYKVIIDQDYRSSMK